MHLQSQSPRSRLDAEHRGVPGAGSRPTPTRETVQAEGGILHNFARPKRRDKGLLNICAPNVRRKTAEGRASEQRAELPDEPGAEAAAKQQRSEKTTVYYST